MKTFDADSIYNRLKSRLSKNPEWALVLGDAAIMRILNTIAEGSAENLRYVENLLNESKWEYARNITSLLTQSQYLGYSPQKKVSAQGTVLISHDSRLLTLGTTLFTEADLQSTLTFYSGGDISIPQGTSFSTPSGISLVSTEPMVYSNGSQYIRVPVIQGRITSVTPSPLLGNPSEIIAITDPLIEDASNSISSKFLTVSARLPNTTSSIPLTRFDDIFLADNQEAAYSVSVSKDLATTYITLGDGISGRIFPEGTQITVTYLQSLGLAGNIPSQYFVNSIGLTPVIPLYTTNDSSIIGGADSDTVEDIRRKAPLSYASNIRSIVSIKDYQAAMQSLPYIGKSYVYSGTQINPKTAQLETAVYYTAITTEGKDANTTTFINDFTQIVEDRASPLDLLQYSSPNFLNLRYNLTGLVPIAEDIATLKENLKNDLYSNFSTVKQDFNTSFDTTKISSYINVNYPQITSTTSLTEAVVKMLPSSFSLDQAVGYTNYYARTFEFDKSLAPFYGIDQTHKYCLKVNIIFTCPNCQDLSRTIFLFPDNNKKINFYCDIPDVTAVTSGKINFCGVDVGVTFTSPITPYSVMNTIYSQVSINPVFTNVYNIAITDGGYLEVSLKNLGGGGGASLNVGTTLPVTGLIFKSQDSFDTVTKQYKYINQITNNAFMLYITSDSLGMETYKELTISDPQYVPIDIDFDYSSLNPVSFNNTTACFGNIHIPLYLSGSGNQGYFINFENPQIDDNVIIEVVAQPISTQIIPLTENSIIKIESITQNNVNIDDIVIQLSAV